MMMFVTDIILRDLFQNCVYRYLKPILLQHSVSSFMFNTFANRFYLFLSNSKKKVCWKLSYVNGSISLMLLIMFIDDVLVFIWTVYVV